MFSTMHARMIQRLPESFRHLIGLFFVDRAVSFPPRHKPAKIPCHMPDLPGLNSVLLILRPKAILRISPQSSCDLSSLARATQHQNVLVDHGPLCSPALLFNSSFSSLLSFAPCACFSALLWQTPGRSSSHRRSPWATACQTPSLHVFCRSCPFLQ